jgi:hypothetical protein
MDIGDGLREATSKGRWSRLAVGEAALALAEMSGGDVDWDEGAGECWARVIVDGRLAGLISAAIPFAIVDAGLENRNWGAGGVVIIYVEDFDLPGMSCPVETLASAFGSSPRLDLLDAGRFSANDLWYSTV